MKCMGSTVVDPLGLCGRAIGNFWCRDTDMDNGRERAYCACSRCGLGLFGYFFLHIISFFCFPLSGIDGWISCDS